MITSMLLLALTVGKPWQHPQGQYRVDMPKCFAAAEGMPVGAFSCNKKDTIANVAVQVFPVQAGEDASRVIVGLIGAVEEQPGYKLLDSTPAKLGGKKATRRRYRVYLNDDPKLAKISEDRVVVAHNSAYVVHVEAMSDHFGSFTKAFNKIYRTFKPLAGAPPAVAEVSGGALVGTWVMVGAEDTVLVLRGDGTFDLAGTAGVFGQQGDQLIMRPEGSGPEKFAWAVEEGDLVLRSPALGEPIRYRRKK